MVFAIFTAVMTIFGTDNYLRSSLGDFVCLLCLFCLFRSRSIGEGRPSGGGETMLVKWQIENDAVNS